MTIILIIIVLLLIVLIVGKVNLYIKFSNEVKELFNRSGDISDQTFHQQQVIDLPDPVRRYFEKVLKPGQLYISYARIKHDGQFKTGIDKPWINIKGEQYATTEKPGFIWKGTTSMFIARDMYIADKGRLIVSLFSLYNVVDVSGDEYNSGELQRWLAESVLYPTNLLPSARLQWSAIDSKSAKLTFDYNELSLFLIITFNEVGEIIQIETKRYMEKDKLETWIIKVSNYREVNKVLVPLSFEALWRLQKGDFSYAKFNITEIEYNRPDKF